VLVEPHADELREVQSHGTHRGGERAPGVRRNGLDAGEQCRVGGQGVVALGDRALGVPGVPHPGREVVRGVLAGEGVVEASLRDHGARAQV